MKSRAPAIYGLIIAAAAYIVWQFVMLYIGNNQAAETSRQLLVADRIIHAFENYPDLHGGHYPSFHNSEEVTRSLDPFLKNEASKVNGEGHPYTSLSELSATASRAIWNQSLSGRIADTYSPTWAFYVQRPDHRFVVAFLSGKVTLLPLVDLNSTIRQP